MLPVLNRSIELQTCRLRVPRNSSGLVSSTDAQTPTVYAGVCVCVRACVFANAIQGMFMCTRLLCGGRLDMAHCRPSHKISSTVCSGFWVGDGKIKCVSVCPSSHGYVRPGVHACVCVSVSVRCS